MTPESLQRLREEVTELYAHAAHEVDRLLADIPVDVSPPPVGNNAIRVTEQDGRTCYEAADGSDLTTDDRSGGAANSSRDMQWMAFHKWRVSGDSRSSEYILHRISDGKEMAVGPAGANPEFSWGYRNNVFFWVDGNTLWKHSPFGQISSVSLETLGVRNWYGGFGSGQPLQWCYGHTDAGREYIQPYDGATGKLLGGWWVDQATNGQTTKLKGGFLLDTGDLLTSPASNSNELHIVGLLDGKDWTRISRPSTSAASHIHAIPDADSNVIVFVDSAQFPGGQNGIVIEDLGEGIIKRWTQRELRAMLTPSIDPNSNEAFKGYISVGHFSVRGKQAMASFTVGDGTVPPPHELGFLHLDWTVKHAVKIKLVEGGHGVGLMSYFDRKRFHSRPSPTLSWDGKWFTYARTETLDGQVKTYKVTL